MNESIQIERLPKDGYWLTWRLRNLEILLGRHKRHRRGREIGTSLLLGAELPAVHNWHIKVEENQARLEPILQNIERLTAIGCNFHSITFRREQIPK